MALIVGLSLIAGVAGGLVTAGVSPVAGFAAVAGGTLALAMLRWPKVGVVAVVAVLYFLPFAVLPVSVGGFSPTFLDAGLTGVLVLWLLRTLLKRERLVFTALDGAVLLFLGLALASLVMGIESTSGDRLRFFFKTINSILFYFTITNMARSDGDVILVARVIVISAAGAAAMAVGLYLMPKDTAVALLSLLRVVGYPAGPGVLRYIADTDMLRAVGTSVDPNLLGGMLLLTMPLAVANLLGRQQLLPRWWGVAGVAVMAAALLLTFSRGAWVGAGAALAAVTLIRHRRLGIFLAAVVFLLLLLPQGDIFWQRVEAGVMAQDKATQMRLGEYRDALRLISSYPWLGVGFGSAPSVDLYVAASSIYLLMAEQMGLVGVSVFVVTMALFVAGNRRVISRQEPLGIVHLGGLAAVVGALVAGIFDHYFFNLQFPHTVAFFWLFVALTVVAARLGGETKIQSP
ncbi:MAG: O-antigen ligase family protein [Chloroflexi bacterium]|nr:O-antigen ligase family protein [Chloroflexota bacterium]